MPGLGAFFFFNLQPLQIFFSKRFFFLLQFRKNNAKLHSSKGGNP
nr:MAG TPA: hypothetical protein [Caudoviricetes sp.]